MTSATFGVNSFGSKYTIITLNGRAIFVLARCSRSLQRG